jgi:hypothetical protein
MATNAPVNNVVFRTIDLNAEIKRIWGPKWNAPTVEYQFSNGREFTRHTEDCALYATSPDHG